MKSDIEYLNLGSIAFSEKGKKPKKTFKQRKKGCLPYIDIKAFEKGIFENFTDGEGCNFCNDGDLLMVWDGSRFGLVGKAYNGAIGSTLVKINVPQCNSDFVFYFLKSKYLIINSRPKGTGTPHVNPDLLWNSPFPIMSIDEQREVVAIIEQLFSDLDNAIDNLRKAKDQLKVYRQSVLKYAFEGKLTEEWRVKHPEVKPGKETLFKSISKVKQPALDLENCADIPQEWFFTSIVNLVAPEKSSLKRGPFGSAIKKAFFVPSGYKVYEQQNAIKKDCSLGTYYINQDKFDELKHFAVHPGNFIVSCAGTIGCITEVPEGSEEGVINQALLKIKLNEDLIVKKFFIHQFESYVQRYMRATSKGSAMKNMSSVKDLKQIPFVYTSIEEQEQIIKEIESRFSISEKMKETIEDSLNQAEALRHSILKQAFEGKLTDKWRKEHPELVSRENSAKALLEKIKAEREALKNTKKRKK